MSKNSVSLAVVVVLSFLATAVGSTHFLCDQSHTRPAGLSSSCGSEDAVLCQAVLDASLSVECWTCPDGITVNWTMTNSSGQQVELNTTEKTLNLSASEVNMQAAGCYQCKCEEAGVPSGVNFSMKVAPGAKPKFSVRNDSHTGNVYYLHPYERTVRFNASFSGMIVVNCSATGYPDPTYTWKVNEKDINDSCSRVENGGKELNFIPTPRNIGRQSYTFSCTVQNGLPNSTIIGKQLIQFGDVAEWLLRPFPAQSGSVVYLSNGLATGVIAAGDYSSFGIDYLVCVTTATVTPADNPACSVDLYMNEGKCCPCTASPCHEKLDLRMRDTMVTDSEELGLSVRGCNFTTSKEQRLLFFARHFLSHSSALIYQLIGFTDVKPLPPAGSASELTIIGGSVGAVLGTVVLSILLCTAAGAGYKCGKRRGGGQNPGRGSTLLNVGEYGTQGDKILLLLDASSYAISVMHMHIVHILSLYIETQNVLSSGSHEARGVNPTRRSGSGYMALEDSDGIADKEIDLAIVARFISRMACHWDIIGMQLRQHELVRNLRRVPNYDTESFCSQVIETAKESGCLQTYGTLLEILESSGVDQQKVASDLRKAVLREGEKARKRGKQGTSAPSQKLTASLPSSTSINA